MARIWLPQRIVRERRANSEREQIRARLGELGVMSIPGWNAMDISELREILVWQEERARVSEPAKPAPRFPPEEIKQALRDARDFDRARKEGRRRLY